MLWLSSAQRFQLLQKYKHSVPETVTGFSGFVPQLFTPGCPSLGVSHQPWQSLLFRPIRWQPPWKLLLHIHLSFLASLPSQQEAVFDLFQLLAHSLCRWHRGLRSEPPGLCSYPWTIPWTKSRDYYGGGIVGSSSLTIWHSQRYAMVGQNLDKLSLWKMSMLLCVLALPTPFAGYTKPKYHMGLCAAVRQLRWWGAQGGSLSLPCLVKFAALCLSQK